MELVAINLKLHAMQLQTEGHAIQLNLGRGPCQSPRGVGESIAARSAGVEGNSLREFLGSFLRKLQGVASLSYQHHLDEAPGASSLDL